MTGFELRRKWKETADLEANPNERIVTEKTLAKRRDGQKRKSRSEIG